MLIWVQIIFIAFVIRFDSVSSMFSEKSKYDYPFEVNHNEKVVELMVVKYTKQLKELNRRVLEWWAKVNRSQKKALTSVCAWPAKVTLYTCQEILKTNYFGFTFRMHDYGEPACNHYAISLKLRKPSELKTNKLFMIRCPPLQYVDLETDQVIVLPITYYISNAQHPDSFFLYLQDGPTAPVYPHKFVSNAGFYGLQLFQLNEEQITLYLSSMQRDPVLTSFALIGESKVSKFTTIRKLRTRKRTSSYLRDATTSR